METIGVIWGFHWRYMAVMLRLYGDNGKENGNDYNGLYCGYIGDNAKENGNCYNGLHWVYIGVILGIMEKKTETTI